MMRPGIRQSPIAYLFDVCDRRQLVALEDRHALLRHVQVQRELGNSEPGQWSHSPAERRGHPPPSLAAPGIEADWRACLSCRSNLLLLHCREEVNW